MALNPVDLEILGIACDMSKDIGDQLNSRQVFEKLSSSLSEDEFYDSLEILHHDGRIRKATEIAPRPPYFSLTAEGILDEATGGDGDNSNLKFAVADEIVNNSHLKQAEIVSSINHFPPLQVKAMLTTLEQSGDIRMRHTVDGGDDIMATSAMLRRYAKGD